MRNFCILLVLTFSLMNCKSSNLEKPENKLSRSEMTDLLYDIYLQQQIVTQSANDVGQAVDTEEIAKNSAAVLKKHKVNYADFEANYRYYSAQPKLYRKILKDVKDQLYEQFSEEEKSRLKNMEKEVQ